MKYDFDTPIDRRNTSSLKYDFALQRGKPADALPFWVADMDFKTAPCVLRALQQVTDHGIFGYTEATESYYAALQGWYETRFGWQFSAESVVKTPGIVYAICAAIRGFTAPGDAVLIQQPVYYPFEESVVLNHRKLVVNQLVYENGAYHIDFEDFENKIIENKIKLFILCSPHNPVGRVWTKQELLQMGEICLRHGAVVVSDEIHADFVYNGHTHHVFAGLSPALAQNCLVCTSPTKTFNLAALQISNIIIPNRALRQTFVAEIDKTGYSQANGFGIAACEAAYREGGPWLDQLQQYLAENLAFVRGFAAENLPAVSLVEPEGTYLVWLDCRKTGLSDSELDKLVLNKAKLWLDGGTMFGLGGSSFQRINIACPRRLLQTAMRRLAETLG
ncbi:MAG: MalY/PatB family protein [Oscillospiraceae bacterium]